MLEQDVALTNWLKPFVEKLGHKPEPAYGAARHGARHSGASQASPP